MREFEAASFREDKIEEVIVGTYEVDKTYGSIMTENIKHTVIQAVSMYVAKRVRYGERERNFELDGEAAGVF